MSELFRKKSLEKINSPESLNDYIRVSNPAVWLILAAVILLLAGTCIWGFFGSLESTVTASARAEDGKVVCVIEEKDMEKVACGQTVRIDGVSGSVVGFGGKDAESGGFEVIAELDIEDGVYTAEIVTEKNKPVSFVLN